MQRKLDLKPSIIWVGGDAFVQIVSARLMGIKADLNVEIRVINKHIATLKRIDYEAIFYDGSEERINADPYIVNGEEISIKPDQTGLASKLRLNKIFPDARRIEIKLLQAHFDDDNSLELIYEKMEKYVDEELDVDDLELLRKVAGQDAYSLSALLMYNWRCVCGFSNGKNVDHCSNCGRSRDQVIEDYSSMSRLISQVEKEIEGEFDIYEQIAQEEEEEVEESVEEIETLKNAQQLSDVDLTDKKEKKKKLKVIEYIKDLVARYPRLALILFSLSGVFIGATIFLWVSNVLM